VNKNDLLLDISVVSHTQCHEKVPFVSVLSFLADRTNGRAYAIQCCGCRRRRL